ncbi:SNARE-binding exocyst subunit S6 [Nowakowskiella sp. JEL0078]|nr:SNARE-binding exocyst subunit S6 [Nowakowskiella sp. JEL0078]
MLEVNELAGIVTDATDGAISRVTDLLRSPDDLTNKLASIRRKFAVERASVDAQLKTAVESQLVDAQRGLDVLHGSLTDIRNVRRNMLDIDRLCADSQNTISNYSRIKKLSQTHQNFKATQDVIEHFQQLNALVSRIQQQLDSDSENILGPADNLLLIHYQQHQLELFRNTTMQKASTSSTDVLNTLHSYFHKVDLFSTRFEEYIWSLTRNLLGLLRHNQHSTVTRLAKIIEASEQADSQASLATPDGISTKFKGYRIKFFDALRETLAPPPPADLPELLATLAARLDDLVLIHDEATPLFPARYNLFHFAVLETHRSIHTSLNRAMASQLDPPSILQLLKWTRDYHHNMLRRIGVAEELLEPRLLDGREDELVAAYVEKVHDKLSEWLANLLKSDVADFVGRERAPEIDGAGMYLLNGSVIVFQMFNQQVDVVAANRGVLLEGVVEVCVGLIEEFQNTWAEVLEAEVGKFVGRSGECKGGIVEYVSALANDAMRSSEFCDSMKGRLELIVDNMSVVESMDKLRDGFMKLAKRGYTALIDIILIDTRPAFTKLYCNEWYEQDLMRLVIGTLEDYCEELQGHMVEYLFSKLTADLLDRFVVMALESLRNRGGKFRMPVAVEKLRSDVYNSTEFFIRFKSAKRVKQSFEVIDKVVAMLESNPRLTYLEFYALFKAFPDVPLQFVEDVIQRRDDLDKATMKEVLESIRSKTREGKSEEEAKMVTVFSKINMK